MDSLPPETVFAAAVCEAEIRYGLARIADGHTRDALIAWMATSFEGGFPHQVLRFDRACAAVYGEIRHAREAIGKPITVEDAMIAATARTYGVRAIATRNTKDFVDCDVTLIDTWMTR